MTDFTPDIIEMVLVAGIPAVLLYIFRMSRRGFKGRPKSPALVHDKTGFIPDLEATGEDTVLVPLTRK